MAPKFYYKLPPGAKGTDQFFLIYQHHKHRAKEAEALTLLRRVASLVKPIMRQRSWKVHTLSEFYPSTARLLGLNVNHGDKICLRLRQHYDERVFLPYEEIVDTMLHELCHIVHGEHNAKFHALWNQLRLECERLIRNGYTGEGFLSEGRRLGGREAPFDATRRIAAISAPPAATGKRPSVFTTVPGQKLGGTPAWGNMDMRKLITDAAEKRRKINEGCASGTQAGQSLAEEALRNGFKTQAEEDDANDRAIIQSFIDLIQQEGKERYGNSYIPPSAANPVGPQSAKQVSAPQSACSHDFPAPQPGRIEDDAYGYAWSCPRCTLANPPMFLCCEACGQERPTVVDVASSDSLAPGQKRRIVHSGDFSDSYQRSKSQKSQNDSAYTGIPEPSEWGCHRCAKFRDREWWACSSCGSLKASPS
ncbi:hypothetical protein LOZ67_002129 [Ophidiomyces ophidiicola]|nr:hypothetical protein LOZ67_002129 [Ophidiomyces ophidiicola]